MKSIGGASVGLFTKMWLRENNIDPKAVDYIQDPRRCDARRTLFQGGMGDYFITDNLSARAMAERNPNVSVAMEMVTQKGTFRGVCTTGKLRPLLRRYSISRGGSVLPWPKY